MLDFQPKLPKGRLKLKFQTAFFFFNPSNSIKPNHLTFIHADADFLSDLQFVRIVVGVETPNQIAVLRMGEDETRTFGGG